MCLLPISLYSGCSGQYQSCPVCLGCSRSWNNCVMDAKSDIAALKPTAARTVDRELNWTWLDTWQTTTWNLPSYGAAQCHGAPYGRYAAGLHDHLRLAHAVPASMRTTNLGKWFPPWTVTRQMWSDALNPRLSRTREFRQTCCSLVSVATRWSTTLMKGISHVSLRGSYLDNLRTSLRSLRLWAGGDRTNHSAARLAGCALPI